MNHQLGVAGQLCGPIHRETLEGPLRSSSLLLSSLIYKGFPINTGSGDREIKE